MPEPTNLELAVRRDWYVDALVVDLREAPWEETEPGRVDRRTYIGPYYALLQLSKSASTEEEWEEAAKEGFEHEIVDEYLEALSSWVAQIIGEHVYAEISEDDVFLGQYQESEPPPPPPPPGVLDWMPPDEEV